MSDIVREGYRHNGFDEWRTRIVGDPRDEWADLLVSKLEPGARVLELVRPDASYDACVSFYVFNHVPSEQIDRVSHASRRLVAAPDMCGRGSRRPRGQRRAPSARASASRKAQRSGAGRAATSTEPEGDASFQWILARR